MERETGLIKQPVLRKNLDDFKDKNQKDRQEMNKIFCMTDEKNENIQMMN